MILMILCIQIIFSLRQNHRCRSHSCHCGQQWKRDGIHFAACRIVTIPYSVYATKLLTIIPKNNYDPTKAWTELSQTWWRTNITMCKYCCCLSTRWVNSIKLKLCLLYIQYSVLGISRFYITWCHLVHWTCFICKRNTIYIPMINCTGIQDQDSTKGPIKTV